MELDSINKRLLGDYASTKAPTVRDQVKASKDAYGRPKYPDLQDNYVQEMLQHYKIDNVDEAVAVGQRMGADSIGGQLSSGQNVRSEDSDWRMNQDELDLLKR